MFLGSLSASKFEPPLLTASQLFCQGMSNTLSKEEMTMEASSKLGPNVRTLNFVRAAIDQSGTIDHSAAIDHRLDCPHPAASADHNANEKKQCNAGSSRTKMCKWVPDCALFLHKRENSILKLTQTRNTPVRGEGMSLLAPSEVPVSLAAVYYIPKAAIVSFPYHWAKLPIYVLTCHKSKPGPFEQCDPIFTGKSHSGWRLVASTESEEARGDDRAGQVVGRDRRPKPTPGEGKGRHCPQNQQQNLNPSLAFYCKSNMEIYIGKRSVSVSAGDRDL